MKIKNPNKTLFIFLIVLLLIPMFQHLTSVVKEKKIFGWVKLAENVSLSTTGWFSGEYQNKKNEYLKDNFGFRPSFVRINNQLDYSLFKKLHASTAVYGKEGYLYEENYIKTYYGIDYVGDSIIENKIKKFEFIKDQLRKLNKELVVLLAPGKGSFYPEFIPDKYRKDSIGNTNYESYKKYLNHYAIPTLDFQDWFLKNKNTSKYPLYPKAGIHWSRYGEILVADSLLNYFSQILNKPMPNLVIDKIELSNKNKFRDYDLGDGFNMLFEVNTLPMGYPEFHLERNSNTFDPKIMFVSDSFYWGLFADNIFKNSNFWYYNEQVYFGSGEASKSAKEVDLLKEIQDHDIIVLLSTDANLYKFPYDFEDRLYELLLKEAKM